MKNRYFDYFVRLLGILFITLGILAVRESFLAENYYQILWLCYSSVIFTGIAFFKKNNFLLISQINILLIPLLVWNIDFFYMIFNGSSLFGITDYFFKQDSFVSLIVSSQHIFIIPLSLLVIYFLGVKRRDSWKLSMIHITSFFIIVRLFTSPEKNINFNFIPFNQFLVNLIPQWIYGFVWFIIFFVMIFLTNFLLIKLSNVRKIYKNL